MSDDNREGCIPQNTSKEHPFLLLQYKPHSLVFAAWKSWKRWGKIKERCTIEKRWCRWRSRGWCCCCSLLKPVQQKTSSSSDSSFFHRSQQDSFLHLKAWKRSIDSREVLILSNHLTMMMLMMMIVLLPFFTCLFLCILVSLSSRTKSWLNLKGKLTCCSISFQWERNILSRLKRKKLRMLFTAKQ